MCFDYEYPEIEVKLLKPIKQKKIEAEKREERPLTVVTT